MALREFREERLWPRKSPCSQHFSPVLRDSCQLGRSDAVAQFYRGKTVTDHSRFVDRRGYDTYGRLTARFLGKHLPGNPTVVTQNMPGAAGTVMGALTWRTLAAKDGTVVKCDFYPGTILDPLIGDKPKGTYDPSKSTTLAARPTLSQVCLARADAPVKTFADIFTHELIIGATADGGSTRDYPVLLNNVLGAKTKIVNGYVGTREIGMATESGEVQGGCGIGWSSVTNEHPEMGSATTLSIFSLRRTADGSPN